MIIEISDDRHKTTCFDTEDILSVTTKRIVSSSGEGYTWDLNVCLRNTAENWEYLTFDNKSAAEDIFGVLRDHMKEAP